MGIWLRIDRPGTSLRLRLLVLWAVTVVAALGITAATLTAIFERHLEQRVAQELAVRLHELAAAFVVEDGAPALTGRLSDPRYDQPLSGSYWQVAGAEGPVLRSRSLWDGALPHDDPRGRQAEAYEIRTGEGHTLYVLERDVRLSAGGPHAYRLSVAMDHAELEALGASFRTDTLLALAVLAAVLVLGAWAQLRLGLQPLARLQAELVRIRQGRASRLGGAFPSEVAPLAESLNALIDQQEETVRRARERAGDLAHGLKTPLAILAAEARRLDEAGDTAAAERLREQIGQMRTHVDRQLARVRSHGAAVAGGRLTDATDTVARLLGLMRRMPRGDSLGWTAALPAGTRLRMDPEDFGEVMGNLLDNARIWARGRVTVAAALEGGRVRIAVEDDGPGIPASQRAALLARGTTGGDGTGLGLAIVSDVLGLYEAGLEIGETPGGGCRMSFALDGWVETEPVR